MGEGTENEKAQKLAAKARMHAQFTEALQGFKDLMDGLIEGRYPAAASNMVLQRAANYLHEMEHLAPKIGETSVEKLNIAKEEFQSQKPKPAQEIKLVADKENSGKTQYLSLMEKAERVIKHCNKHPEDPKTAELIQAGKKLLSDAMKMKQHADKDGTWALNHTETAYSKRIVRQFQQFEASAKAEPAVRVSPPTHKG